MKSLHDLKPEKFKIIHDEKLGFFGYVIHPDDNEFCIYIKERPHDDLSNIGVPSMAIFIMNDNTYPNFYDALHQKILQEQGTSEMEELITKAKESLKEILKNHPVIFIDPNSAKNLKNGCAREKSILFHEIGHYINRDKVYDEQIEREDCLSQKGISQKEIDADDFAFSVFRETFYDALRYCEQKLENAFKTDGGEKYFVPLFETKLRADRLGKILLSEL